MPGIVTVERGIYRNRLKCIYLKHQKRFVDILLHFYNVHKFLDILEKKPWAQ